MILHKDEKIYPRAISFIQWYELNIFILVYEFWYLYYYICVWSILWNIFNFILNFFKHKFYIVKWSIKVLQISLVCNPLTVFLTCLSSESSVSNVFNLKLLFGFILIIQFSWASFPRITSYKCQNIFSTWGHQGQTERTRIVLCTSNLLQYSQFPYS